METMARMILAELEHRKRHVLQHPSQVVLQKGPQSHPGLVQVGKVLVRWNDPHPLRHTAESRLGLVPAVSATPGHLLQLQEVLEIGALGNLLND
eukprot:227807-Hanusia_phi.AAC.1